MIRHCLSRAASHLQQSIKYNALIYLRDHNKLITPQKSQWKLSHHNPKNLTPGAPQQSKIQFKLSPELEEDMEKQIFEEYKKKILTGTIDQVEQKPVDEIWGEEDPPIHYYSRIGKSDLMTVTHPQNKIYQSFIHELYSVPFRHSSNTQSVTLENIRKADPHQLVGYCLQARWEGVEDRTVWWTIEEGFQRGMVFHHLSSEELIKIKWAFCGRKKTGSPQFNAILADILREDVPSMSKDQLVSLFYACWYSNTGHTSLQKDVLKALEPHYPSFSFQQKVNFLLLFTLATHRLRYERRVQKRRRFEFKDFARSLLFRLDFWDLQLTDDLASRLIFSLAKLRMNNTKFITLPLVEHIESNWESFTADATRVLVASIYLPELQDCEGVTGQQLQGRLRSVAQSKWEDYSSVEKIRLVHAYWDMGLMDEGLQQLYGGIQLQADSTLLHYACQIELGASSGREWQIVQLMAQVQTVPLPYFTSYKRFYNYIANTTEWNLTPLKDKLLNTETHHDVLRNTDSLLNHPTYPHFVAFQKFVDAKLATTTCPIGNLELTHFAYPQHQIALDLASKKDFIHGTKQLRESFLNKRRSLQNIGWKHLAIDNAEFDDLTIMDIIKNAQDAHEGFEEDQQAIIEYADYQQMKYIEHVKTAQFLQELDTKYLNFILFPEEIEDDDLESQDQFYRLIHQPDTPQAIQEQPQ